MSKTKTPFLSLGSTGSLGGSITTQKLGSATLVRAKPTPAYRYTLPQAYQRWLYEDYAHLWTQQTEATQRQYTTKGSPFHLTGFHYWMKEHLRGKADILGQWSLDEKTGSTSIDTSPNKNHGIIIGASPIPGTIDYARNFDKIDDHIDIPDTPSLHHTGSIAFEAYFTITDITQAGTILNKGYQASNRHWWIMIYAQKLYFELGFTTTRRLLYNIPLPPSPPYHLICAWNALTKLASIHLNGALAASATWDYPALGTNPYDLYFGTYLASGYWYSGYLDNLTILTRVPDLNEILRHSQRRYP